MGSKKKKMGALEKKLYILHGWSTDTSGWMPFLEQLRKEGITPVFLLIPGLTAPLDKPWTLDDYVEWLYQTVKNDTKISLLGHSNGGRIAIAFAHKYPDEVGQLFLLDSAGIYHNDFFTNAKRNFFQAVSKIGKKITSSETARSVLYKLTQESDYKNASPMMQKTMKHLICVDLLLKLPEIKTPTVIIWGKEDNITPFTDALVMKQGLPNSKLFPISGVRHSPQFTNISEVTKIVKENLI